MLHGGHPTLGSTVFQYLCVDWNLRSLHSDTPHNELNEQLLILLKPLSHSWANRIIAFSAHFGAQHTMEPSHHMRLSNFLDLAVSQVLPARAADSMASSTAPVTDLLDLLLSLHVYPGDASGQTLTAAEADISLSQFAEATASTWEQQGAWPEENQYRDAAVVSTSILLVVKLLNMFSSWDFSEPIEQAVVVAMWFTLSNITEPLYRARTSALCSIAQSKPPHQPHR